MPSSQQPPHPDNQTPPSGRDVAKRRRREHLKAQFFNAPLASNRYTVSNVIGGGAYGIVCSALDTSTGEKVAVKRILRVLDTHPMATRILRELKFLRLLSKHENIIQVKDVLLPGHLHRFNDAFVVFELMPTDLSRLLRSATELRPDHIKYFMFQLLRGITFLHSARVFHRDLKPNNILINQNCDLRICDLGLARAAFENCSDTTFWTDYVATRWYRAPELLMDYLNNYSTAIDMWSVGCIFAEMLGNGQVLFPGRNSRHQFDMIIHLLGPPPLDLIQRLDNPQAVSVLTPFLQPNSPSTRTPRQHRPLHARFRHANPQAVDLLSRMLTFDPHARISALDALNHPYFSEYRHLGLGATTTPLPATEFAFERQTMTPDRMREEFLREILHYHPDQSADVLRSWAKGQQFVRPSSAERFEQQMDALADHPDANQLQSQTLQERVLGHITDHKPVAHHRHHATMTESELAHYTR